MAGQTGPMSLGRSYAYSDVLLHRSDKVNASDQFHPTHGECFGWMCVCVFILWMLPAIVVSSILASLIVGCFESSTSCKESEVLGYICLVNKATHMICFPVYGFAYLCVVCLSADVLPCLSTHHEFVNYCVSNQCWLFLQVLIGVRLSLPRFLSIPSPRALLQLH